jgi:NADPH:quinone reductase
VLVVPKAFRFYETDGPEVLKWEDVTVGEPGPSEARIRHTAVGVNFSDVYMRTGFYLVSLPSGLGSEGAGVVEAVGQTVRHIKPGDRVAYAGGPPGSYAEVRLIPADRLLKIPDGISDQQAAAMMLKGMTAQFLIHRVYKVQAGDLVLFHAAAGGVGLIACQWLKALDAVVIGTVGSEEKVKLARAHGCDYAIDYTREDFVKRVREISGGKGLPVVYDSVGKSTFQGSLDCLRPLGLLVSFGNASGPVPPFDPAILAQKGSLYLTRPNFFTYTASRADVETAARDLFDVVLAGKVKIQINHSYALKDAPQVHRDLESRKTTGSIIMLP